MATIAIISTVSTFSYRLGRRAKPTPLPPSRFHGTLPASIWTEITDASDTEISKVTTLEISILCVFINRGTLSQLQGVLLVTIQAIQCRKLEYFAPLTLTLSLPV